jgi:exodeoxyribonuclease-3
MKIATYNVNGVNGRLAVLMRCSKKPSLMWCACRSSRHHKTFPEKAINDAGYQAIWHGQKQWNGVAILSKFPIEEIGRGLLGDPDDLQSRYLEAMINGVVIACLYLPNGNPAPAQIRLQLGWFKRLHERAATLLQFKTPVIPVGDFNVMPTELDGTNPSVG